jgi:hypothetical protein
MAARARGVSHLADLMVDEYLVAVRVGADQALRPGASDATAVDYRLRP